MAEVDALMLDSGQAIVEGTLQLTLGGKCSSLAATRLLLDEGRVLVVAHEIEADERTARIDTLCEVCCSPLERHRRSQRFCSASCRHLAFWRRQHAPLGASSPGSRV